MEGLYELLTSAGKDMLASLESNKVSELLLKLRKNRWMSYWMKSTKEMMQQAGKKRVKINN